MISDDVIKKVKNFYPKYNKNCNIYPFINDIELVDANPHSDVYKIIEELSATN